MTFLLHLLLAVLLSLGGAGGHQPQPIKIHVPRTGHQVGTVVIPRLHLRAPIAQGTGDTELATSVGHLESSYLPGMGGDTALFGHRVTPWGGMPHGPFRYINRLRVGDRVIVRMPYGTYTYRVTTHRVVLASDWRLFRPRLDGERLLLAACHPPHDDRYRYVVIAKQI